MTIVLKARCRLLQANSRIVRAQFDVAQGHEPFGEYVLTNLAYERGLLDDGKIYRITIKPFYPHIVEYD